MKLIPSGFRMPSIFNPAGLPSAADLLLLVWKFYLEHLRRLLKISVLALLAFPLTLPGMLLTATGLSTSGRVIYRQPSLAEPATFLWVGLGSLAALLLTAYVRAALIDGIESSLSRHGGEPSHGRSRHLRTYLHYLAALLITGAAMSVGFALLFIPGVIAAAYLLFAEPIVVLESATVFEALKRSVRMVRGRFWGVLWRLLIVNGVFALSTTLLGLMLVQLPLMLLRASPYYTPERLPWLASPFLFLAWVVSALTLPLFLSFQVVLYQEMKKLKA